MENIKKHNYYLREMCKTVMDYVGGWGGGGGNLSKHMLIVHGVHLLTGFSPDSKVRENLEK